VFEPALPLSTEDELKEPPRGEEELDDVLACAWICGRAGSRSVGTDGRGAYWGLYQPSTGPREWTDVIDGSSSFSVLEGCWRWFAAALASNRPRGRASSQRTRLPRTREGTKAGSGCFAVWLAESVHLAGRMRLDSVIV
jgi:hypothetical protein